MNSKSFTDKELLQEIEKYTRHKTLKKDEVLLSPGSDILFVPVVERGVLRIVRENDEGKEVFLYHLYPGEACAMAINCCSAGGISLVKAIAEDDTEVRLIPGEMVEEWYKYPEWKSFINNTYAARFAELIEVIDLIAFSNMDKQLMRYLRERATASGTNILPVTHQQIADELRTHREAISRLLRTMEGKNLVRLGRNTIEILF